MNTSIGEAARLAGVTVRTLHHYDDLGLVVAGRLANGHRIYDRSALERLQQVRFFVELEFPLDEIKRIMSDPAFDRGAALRHQRELLTRRLSDARRVLDAIELAILAEEEGDTMTTDDMFDGFNPEAYAEEAEERWGGTEEYDISVARTKGYTKQDWETIQAEVGDIHDALAKLMRAGSAPDGEEATAAAERHRLHIDRWFYPCSHTMHMALADMYVSDARFTDYYEKIEPGMAMFLRDAIAANGETTTPHAPER